MLRSGQRLRVTGYERINDIYVLHMAGGRLELPAAEIVAIEPEDAFGRTADAMERTPFDTLITAAALKHGVDERLITSMIAAESNFDPRAISPKDARGLMQLMPATALRFGVTDIFNPEQNINAGSRYLRELLDRYSNDLPLALAAYNAGPERVAQYRGVPPFRETRDYIARVTERLQAEATSTSAFAANN
ncbi:MAG: lytic transglycosylase domain-containing protein [Candidatus Acidiferrales bacterium]